ncbi:uncharacterized protein LOC143430653 [Xylocopa sonorina]|uniref:uncharacterized protein LOC143430653 n=1 Tax=Xylocopa sonorina TaxID=1818115 RepID=UPI00403AB67B
MRILVIQIATTLLIIALCWSNASGKAVPEEADDAQGSETTTGTIDTTVPSDIDDDLDTRTNKTDEADEADKENNKEQPDDELPILPPIILLDFGNNTDDENGTSEEKSKRTVNGGLGYGFDQNNLRPRKYSYYFPAGKSGTTVSIEESISPFLPKTIVERVHPGSQSGHIVTRQNPFSSSTYSHVNTQLQSHANLQPLNLQQSAESQTVFGLRTKPQKAGSTFVSYQNFPTTSKPLVSSFAIQNSGYGNNEVRASTQSPLAHGNAGTVGYVTSSTANLANSRASSFSYPTSVPFSGNENSRELYADQRQNVRSNVNPHGFVPQTARSASSLNYNPHFQSNDGQYSNAPRYTVENGVSYENKVFWKYPDGTVSDMPPRTYVETTYSEYPLQQQQQPAKSQSLHSIYETSTTENGILSQGPVQFPAVSDETGRKPNPFVSADSLSSSLPQQQVYRLGYQNLVTQRQNVNFAQQRKPAGNPSASYSPPSSVSSASSLGRTRPGDSNSGYESRYQHQLPRYMVNSPNPEYTATYTTESTMNSTTPISQPFDSSTEDPFQIKSSSYSSKVESYLDTILSSDDGSKKQSLASNDLNSYSNLQYSDLLNYNPSISEYVRNPSSILNVRPTFVQAGNSLIPVIILRVDGASPIQTKPAQNINLKALLQQYLIQYAKSIQQLAEPSTYNLGGESPSKGSTSASNRSPVLDLIRLTQDDARQSPSYSSNSYTGKSSYETSNLGHASDFVGSDYVQRTSGRQKVKSVEILDDPRYTSYKG